MRNKYVNEKCMKTYIEYLYSHHYRVICNCLASLTKQTYRFSCWEKRYGQQLFLAVSWMNLQQPIKLNYHLQQNIPINNIIPKISKKYLFQSFPFVDEAATIHPSSTPDQSGSQSSVNLLSWDRRLKCDNLSTCNNKIC